MAKRKRRREAPTVKPAASSVSSPSGGAWSARATGTLLILLGVVPMANLVTTGAGLPWWSIAVRQWAVWNLAIVGICFVIGHFATAHIERAFDVARRQLLRPAPWVFALGAAMFALAASLLSGWILFRLQPVVGDEFAQRFQALLLTKGHLSAHAALPREFFNTSETLDVDGRWFSQFPIGGPALLALGTAVSAPWIVNPICTAIATVAVYAFVRSTTNETTARITTLLTCISPFIVYMGGTQMNHPPTLALLWIALALLPALVSEFASTRARRVSAIGIGACVGLAATIRPFDAFVCASLIGLFQLATARERSGFWQLVAIQCAAAAVPITLLLLANGAVLGAPLPFAYDVLNGPEHRPGFHATPLGFDHTPRRGLYMVSAYLLKLNVALFNWPAPAILLIATSLLLVQRVSKWDRLLFSLLVVFLLGYAAYWSESYFLGPRFLFVIGPVLILYTALLPRIVRDRVLNPSVRAAALLYVPLLIVGAWLAPTGPTSQFGVRQLAHLYRMRSAAADVDAEVRRAGLTNAVVFIRETWRERLLARLRAVGIRPLAAEHLLAVSDACVLQRGLDEAERQAAPPAQAVRIVNRLLEEDLRLSPVAPVMTTARIALMPARALDPICQAEYNDAPATVLTLAEMLPYSGFTRGGDLDSAVVYARDFGASNERLRTQFGQRAWYAARVEPHGDSFRVSLVPYADPSTTR